MAKAPKPVARTAAVSNIRSEPLFWDAWAEGAAEAEALLDGMMLTGPGPLIAAVGCMNALAEALEALETVELEISLLSQTTLPALWEWSMILC